MPPSRKAFYERAKTYYAPIPRRKVVAKRTRAAAVVVPGYTRKSGFYGRYNRGTRAEMKFFDTANSFLFDSTGEVPATGQLALIPQGDTESTRDGRQCTIKSVQIRGYFKNVPAAGATSPAIAYLYLVLDKQANGAAAGVTDLFTSANMWDNMLNLANSDRFRILKKWVVPLNAGAGVTTAYDNTVKVLEFYKRCNIPMSFSSTTGAITEIRSNNLFLMAGAAVVDDQIAFEGRTRVRFTG